jgi:hypothetical protein
LSERKVAQELNNNSKESLLGMRAAQRLLKALSFAVCFLRSGYLRDAPLVIRLAV